MNSHPSAAIAYWTPMTPTPSVMGRALLLYQQSDHLATTLDHLECARKIPDRVPRRNNSHYHVQRTRPLPSHFTPLLPLSHRKSLFDFFVLSQFLSRFLSAHFLLAQQVVFVIFLNRTTQNFDIPEGTAVVFVAPSYNRTYSVCSGVRGTVGQSPRGDGLYYSGPMRPMDKFWYVFNQKGTYFFFDCLSQPNQDIGGSFRVSPSSKFVCVCIFV